MFRGSSNSNIDDTSESASSTQAANTLDDFINNRLETVKELLLIVVATFKKNGN